MEKEIPLYRMIYNKIVNRILVGFYPKGYQLPSAQKIHAQAEIGYTSIRRAMRLLQEEGFIFWIVIRQSHVWFRDWYFLECVQIIRSLSHTWRKSAAVLHLNSGRRMIS